MGSDFGSYFARWSDIVGHRDPSVVIEGWSDDRCEYSNVNSQSWECARRLLDRVIATAIKL